MSITLIIVAITCVVSIYAFSNQSFFNSFNHHPYVEWRDKSYYRMLTSGFLHGSWLHLGINMFVLWQFGEIAEMYYAHFFGETLGGILYVAMYLTAIIVGDLPSFFKHRDNASYRSIGASGAVSGVLFVFVLIAPWEMLYLYGIIPIPAIIGAVAYIGYSQWASKQENTRIDHDAHMYGALYGMIFTIIMKPDIVISFWNMLIAGPQ